MRRSNCRMSSRQSRACWGGSRGEASNPRLKGFVMAEKIPQHPLVQALVPDPEQPPQPTVKLVGLPGTSPDASATRVARPRSVELCRRSLQRGAVQQDAARRRRIGAVGVGQREAELRLRRLPHRAGVLPGRLDRAAEPRRRGGLRRAHVHTGAVRHPVGARHLPHTDRDALGLRPLRHPHPAVPDTGDRHVGPNLPLSSHPRAAVRARHPPPAVRASDHPRAAVWERHLRSRRAGRSPTCRCAGP